MTSARKSTLLTLILSSFVLGTFILPCNITAAEAKLLDGVDLSVVKQKGGKRIALVVGVDEYPEVPLILPVRDAELVTKQLESVGFEVMLVKNPTLGVLVEAREKFVKKINESGEDVTALFFFAGHAVQFDGHNYLIPAKSQLLPSADNSFSTPGPAAFIDRGMDVQSRILNYLGDSKASKIIFVLDACRVNPYRPDHRSSTRANGLLKMNVKSSNAETFILFAASPGEVALDGGTTALNSPFTQSFANAIAQPGSSLTAVYQQVSEQVQKSTNKKQRPYQEGSLFSFMFREPVVVPIVSTGQNKMISTGFEKRDYDLATDGVNLLRKVLKRKSLKEILSAAESGDPEAQYLAAVAYNLGEDIPKDLTKPATG